MRGIGVTGKWIWVFAAGGILLSATASAVEKRVVERKVVVTKPERTEPGEAGEPAAGSNRKEVVIERIEPPGERHPGEQVAWLGVATEESTDALAAQLGLNPGEGLIVTYVAPDSPAGKAGLQKNDLLTQFGDQLLVYPAQLKKLVLMRKEADEVEITYFRAGKKESVLVTLGKHAAGAEGLPEFRNIFEGNMRDLQRQLHQLPIREELQTEMKNLRESLARAGIDKERLSSEIKRSLEQARRSAEEALRQATNAARGSMSEAARRLEDLARRTLEVEKNATVTIKSESNSVQTMVKSDDTGTYVLVANPQKRLTAHDKDGKLLFDGEIETPEQQEKVPRAVWEKVEPLVDKLNSSSAEEQKAEELNHEKHESEE